MNFASRSNKGGHYTCSIIVVANPPDGGQSKGKEPEQINILKIGEFSKKAREPQK